METLEARRRLFREQVDRLAAFSLDYIDRHRQDVHAIDRQRDNLLQMVTACGEYLGDWPRAAQIALGLEEYMLRRGRWRSWADHLEEIAHALAEDHAPALEGRVWHALGNAYCGSGQWAAAIRAHRRAIDALRRAGDPQGLAHALFDLGRTHWFRGEWREALRRYRQADAHARSLPGGSLLRARIANVIGLTYWGQGKWRRAVRSFRRALRLCPGGPEYARNRGRMLSNLALALTDLGRWEEAEQTYRTALQFSEQAGDTTGLAYTWGDLGDLYRRQARWAEAEACLERAESLWRETEDEAGLADLAEHRGRLYADLGRATLARRWLRQALTLWQDLGNEHKVAELCLELAKGAETAEEAARWIARAATLARRLRRSDLLLRILLDEGRTAWRRRHPLRALRSLVGAVGHLLISLGNDRARRAAQG